MKIVFVSTDLSNGGAAIACRNQAHLVGKAEDVRLVDRTAAITKGKRFFGINTGYVVDLANRAAAKVLRVIDLEDNGIFKSYGIFFGNKSAVGLVNAYSPDLVHLHWIGGEFMTIKNISEFNAPIVWTMHDCWAFSGSEHHQKVGRENDPTEGYRNRGLLSLSKRIFERKKKYFAMANIHVICPSEWIYTKAKSSLLFRDRNIYLVPNSVDTMIFRSYGHRGRLRSAYNLPTDKKLLLVGSLTKSSDPVKGYDLLMEALLILFSLRTDWGLVTLGDLCNREKVPFDVYAIQPISCPNKMADLFNAVDVTCVPSRIETHSMMAAESLCCEVPVVAFDVAGNNSVVDHDENGYLAKYEDCYDFAEGICWCLQMATTNKEGRNRFSKARARFSPEKSLEAHLEIYKKAISPDIKN